MVKADYKRDYYADLDLTSTADTETIKRKFRELAKQYHPDRNPGKEVDVVPRFQAIQAAHEVLGDPIQKAKYDAERAKLNRPRDAESPTFKKPPPPRRADTAFPPNGTYAQQAPGAVPRRDPSANRYAPQNGPWSRPASTANGADKFAQFARAAPQQWDHSRYEEAARAEGLRGFNAMRAGPMPQTSPLRTRPPTAPKSAGVDPYSSGGEPSPGFPGLNRGAHTRRGYGSPDDPPPPPASAYAHYRRDRERPPSASAVHHDTQSQSRTRDSDPPLRPSRPFQSGEFSSARPGLNRTGSRYAQASGERTQINTDNLHRSTSVRNSPIDRKWEERGPFGATRSPEERAARPRHRSLSPSSVAGARSRFDYASQSTSSDSDEIPTPQERKKAPLRRPQTTYQSNNDGPGLTGYFPGTNYTRVVNDDSDYDFPAPEAKSPPVRKPFPNMTSPLDGHDAMANEPDFQMPSHHRLSKHESNTSNEDTNNDKKNFHADEWHEHFDTHADLFTPPENLAKERKSPSKPMRGSRSGQARSFAPSKEGRRDGIDNNVEQNIAAGVRHVDPDSINTKASAFQAGKLGSDFVQQVNGTRRGSQGAKTKVHDPQPNGKMHSSRDATSSASDEMDIDSPAPADTTDSGGSTVNGNVDDDSSWTSVNDPPSPRQQIRRHNTDPKRDGFNLEDMKKTGPFGPSDTGLKDLEDLANNLPFQSQPAETMATLRRTSSSQLRHLNLPRPPKLPSCPADTATITSDTWRVYTEAMNLYMADWNKFNASMIQHFDARQTAVMKGMWRNWICAVGDGASADDYEKSGGKDMAGYATYMTWLDDDRKCRVWWDVACEEHRLCMEGLGRVRKRVKELSSQAGGGGR